MTWIGETADGEQVHLKHKPQPVDGEFARVAYSRRAPDPRGTQTWDFEAGRWVTVAERARDLVSRDHLDAHGHRAIDLAHAAKAIEAGLILAGVEIDGFIAAESRATGRAAKDIAETVMAAARPMMEAEAQRVARRRRIGPAGTARA